MEPAVLLGSLAGLVLFVGMVVVLRRGRRAASARNEICMFCLKPLAGGDQLVALLEPYARELLGVDPPERSATTDPEGRQRWVAHVRCARAMQKEICLFCQVGIMPGDKVAGLKKSYARELLGGEPPERSVTTTPHGQPCCVAHAHCASAAGMDLNMAHNLDDQDHE